jgi:hypothetical protein
LHDPAFYRGRLIVPVDVVAADHVQNQIDTRAAGLLFDGLDEIMLPVIDRQIRAQFTNRGAFGLRTRGREDLRSKGLGKLNGCRADARGAAVYQKRSPGFQAAALKHIVPDREEGLRNRCGLDQCQAVGRRQGIGFVNHTEFGIAAARHQRADLVADLNRLAALPIPTTSPAISRPGMSDAPGGGG